MIKKGPKHTRMSFSLKMGHEKTDFSQAKEAPEPQETGDSASIQKGLKQTDFSPAAEAPEPQETGDTKKGLEQKDFFVTNEETQQTGDPTQKGLEQTTEGPELKQKYDSSSTQKRLEHRDSFPTKGIRPQQTRDFSTVLEELEETDFSPATEEPGLQQTEDFFTAQKELEETDFSPATEEPGLQQTGDSSTQKGQEKTDFSLTNEKIQQTGDSTQKGLEQAHYSSAKEGPGPWQTSDSASTQKGQEQTDFSQATEGLEAQQTGNISTAQKKIEETDFSPATEGLGPQQTGDLSTAQKKLEETDLSPATEETEAQQTGNCDTTQNGQDQTGFSQATEGLEPQQSLDSASTQRRLQQTDFSSAVKGPKKMGMSSSSQKGIEQTKFFDAPDEPHQRSSQNLQDICAIPFTLSAVRYPKRVLKRGHLSFDSSDEDDDDDNDPDFDLEGELKRTKLRRCKIVHFEESAAESEISSLKPNVDSHKILKRRMKTSKKCVKTISSSDETDGSGSEEVLVKKPELQRKRLKLSEKDGSCSNKTVNEDNREPLYRKTLMGLGNVTLTVQNEEVPKSDSDESDNSDVWPMLSKPSGGSTTIVDYSDSEENSSIVDEDCIARDKEHKGIYVTRVLKSTVTKTGKVKKSDRVYNSRHPCPFCAKWQTNFSHHILSKQHSEEPEVLKIMKLESNSKERKRLIDVLRLRGEHQHNVQVIKEKQGELLLGRRSVDQNFCIDDYTPCPNCLEWIRISVLKRHQPHCPAKTDFTVSKGSLIIQSKIITGKIDENASQSLVGEVFPIMIEDQVGKIAKTDPLIINLGNQWMQRNVGNRIMRKYYTSSIMRLAARLLMIARQMAEDESIGMDSLLQPKYFDVVARAALKCSKQDELDEENLQSPSNAVKLGFDIKRMACAKLAMSLIGDDQGKKEEAKAFLTLLKIKWGLQVTKLARMVLSEKNFNKPTQLPLPEDVKTLATFMTERLTNADITDESYENFKQIAQLVLARLTLYNRRRCHEVQALRLESYHARKKDADEIAVEIVGELTTFERELLKRQEVVEIRGKTGRGVPVIIPQDVKRTMAYLADENVRKKAGIQSCSPYFFANSQAGVFRAYDAIKAIAESAGLKNPGKMRTSNMRKYMATMLQSLDTTENERQWVVDHLGHTMKIHLTHYRQTSDVLERVEIAKLLLIQDMGLVGQYRGKQLKDIQLNDILGIKESEEGVETPETSEAPVELPVEEDIPNLFDLEEEDEDEGKENLAEGKRVEKKKQKTARKKWSIEEEEEIKKLFDSFLKKDKCPGQKDIEKAMAVSRKSSNGLIHLRPRDNIKKKVSSILVKARKNKKK